jgi:hypothetical protein
MSLLGLLLKPLPWLAQDNWSVIVLALPVHLAVAWTADRLAREVAAPARGAAANRPTRRARAARPQPSEA